MRFVRLRIACALRREPRRRLWRGYKEWFTGRPNHLPHTGTRCRGAGVGVEPKRIGRRPADGQLCRCRVDGRDTFLMVCEWLTVLFPVVYSRLIDREVGAARLPIGVVTAIVGAPLFLAILRRSLR